MNPASLWDGVAMWLVNHSVPGLLFSIAVSVVLLAVICAAASACVYWALFVRRLWRKENRDKFLETPIPGVLRGKVAGQEFELAVSKAETVAIGLADQTLEEMNYRLSTAEATLKKLEEAWERLEDVSGRA